MKKLPYKVTKELLESHGACPEEVDRFSKAFPDGVELTLPNCLRVANLNFNISWFVANFAPNQLKKAYDKGEAQLKKAYDEGIARLSKAYYEGEAPLSKAYEAGKARIWKAYENGIAPLKKAYYEGEDPLSKAYQEGVAQLLAKLAKTRETEV